MTQPSLRTGYLVLADLTGFTPFVASAEIEHAQGILSNLLDLLRRRLTPTLTLAEVEGDALFLYVTDDHMTRGETLMDLVESTYVAFRDRIGMAARNTVCPCAACRMIPTLDLKFVAHWGEFVLQEMGGPPKPFGSCVNLVHRLLKNDVTENTGWRAYALFTDDALRRMGVTPEGGYQQTLEYPHLGECTVSAVDLRSRFDALTSERTSFLADEEAHFVVRRSYPLPRARLWELMTDIEQRNAWEVGSDLAAVTRPLGRVTRGAKNHCAASGFIEELLDARPFDYFTTRLSFRALHLRITAELVERGDLETDLCWRMALESILPGPLRGPACRLFAKRLMRVPARFEKLDALVEGEAGVADAAAGREASSPGA